MVHSKTISCLRQELLVKRHQQKFKTKAEQLHCTLGGIWTYDNFASWYCDDKKRHVTRTCSDIYDEDAPPDYWLYGDGPPQLIRWRYVNLGLEIVI